MSASTAPAPKLSPSYHSLFGFSDDRAVVIGLPDGFNFEAALTNATEIRLATAFAHMQGWKLIAPAILRSRGTVQLIAGLDFFQTEPKLLLEIEAPERAYGRQARNFCKAGNQSHHLPSEDARRCGAKR